MRAKNATKKPVKESEFPYTRKVLDIQRCDTPGCKCLSEHIYLFSGCHPDAGLDAVYSKVDGTYTFSCHECQAFVSQVQIAGEPHVTVN